MSALLFCLFSDQPHILLQFCVSARIRHRRSAVAKAQQVFHLTEKNHGFNGGQENPPATANYATIRAFTWLDAEA